MWASILVPCTSSNESWCQKNLFTYFSSIPLIWPITLSSHFSLVLDWSLTFFQTRVVHFKICSDYFIIRASMNFWSPLLISSSIQFPVYVSPFVLQSFISFLLLRAYYLQPLSSFVLLLFTFILYGVSLKFFSVL